MSFNGQYIFSFSFLQDNNYFNRKYTKWPTQGKPQEALRASAELSGETGV